MSPSTGSAGSTEPVRILPSISASDKSLLTIIIYYAHVQSPGLAVAFQSRGSS